MLPRMKILVTLMDGHNIKLKATYNKLPRAYRINHARFTITLDVQCLLWCTHHYPKSNSCQQKFVSIRYRSEPFVLFLALVKIHTLTLSGVM